MAKASSSFLCQSCGAYRYAGEKHPHRYVDEFTFRLNHIDMKRQTLDRLASLAAASIDPRNMNNRIAYMELAA